MKMKKKQQQELHENIINNIYQGLLIAICES